MNPNTDKPVSARSCLRHAKRELAAAEAASSLSLKAVLMQSHDAWMARYKLTAAASGVEPEVRPQLSAGRLRNENSRCGFQRTGTASAAAPACGPEPVGKLEPGRMNLARSKGRK